MDFIYSLKEQNIKFQTISEQEAEDIIRSEYSYHKLLSYACLFEKYTKNVIKKGQFVNLDFSQLYYLAEIDSRFSHILMSMCLEIEEKIKTKFIFEAGEKCDTKVLLSEYYSSDHEYLDATYALSYDDVVVYKRDCNDLLSMTLDEFLGISQFGTLERLICFFYKEYEHCIHKSALKAFETRLSSIRRIRNIVAHNNSILNKLTVKTEYQDLKMLSFLGKHGIKNRTLKTNMSRQIISDLCGVIDVYFELVNNDTLIKELKNFDVEYCQKWGESFSNNDILKTAYTFLREVFALYFEKYKKNT